MTTVSGLSRAAEQRANQRIVTLGANRAQHLIAREIARAMTEAAGLVAKGEPMAADMITHQHQQTMGLILGELWRVVGQASVERMLRISKSAPAHEIKQEVERDLLEAADNVDELVAQWIRTFGGEHITQITETTKNEITRVIAQGHRDGLTNSQIAKQILAVAPEKSASRAVTIAITEAGFAQGSASQFAAELSTTPMVKVWVAAVDERTRQAHIDANNQERPLDQDFLVANADGEMERMKFPGDDRFASAENLINCRCICSYELA